MTDILWSCCTDCSWWRWQYFDLAADVQTLLSAVTSLPATLQIGYVTQIRHVNVTVY